MTEFSDYYELPRNADEHTTLLSFLAWQRATFERKCAGLNDEQLRARSAPPSTLSLLGLTRHLADVERGWLRRTLGGDEVADRFGTEQDPDADFNGVDSADVGEAFAAWRAEREHGDTVIAAHQLDDTVRQRTGREVSMRWILTHLVEEYSRHNGHADLLRERIDGATGY
ncbi:MAG: DinB family protein [Candidatus Dormibacteraeota bacterium]|nr:DinB family protein [Candidatus Dormibacteraeota bacterium]